MWVGGERITDATQQFEKGRIRTLQEERIRVQEKTFTKWINFHLKPTGMQVDDLFEDIRNGCMLHKLLEIISGEQLPKVSRGRMRIQQLENVGICLTFLSKKVRWYCCFSITCLLMPTLLFYVRVHAWNVHIHLINFKTYHFSAHIFK